MYMGSQCKGFANWIFLKIFGVYIGAYPENANYKLSNANAQLVGMITPGSLNESTAKTLLQKASPGTIYKFKEVLQRVVVNVDRIQ